MLVDTDKRLQYYQGKIMDEFNKILLQLYECEFISGISLLQNSLDLLNNILPFDAAVWSKVSYTDKKLSFHECSYFNSFPQIQSEWELIKKSSFFSNSHNDYFSFSDSEKQSCGKIYHEKNFLIVIYPNNRSNGFEILSLYKQNRQQDPISRSANYLCYLMPHLVKLYNNHQIHTMAKSTVAKHGNQFQLAIATKNGILDSSENDFIKRLLCEWPTWSGPELPLSLVERINDNKFVNYQGNNIVIYFKKQDKYIYLFARGIADIDKLSNRELTISKLFSLGKTYKEIAKYIDISPSTVRVHLNKAYIKLNINSKIQLVNIIRQADVGTVN